MIDYIKLNKRLTRVEVEQLKKSIDFYSTFNTATGEEVSMSSNGKRVLTHLLGWEKMIDKVDEAHIKVLEEFKVEKIWNSLRKRGREVRLSEYVVNKGIMICNPRKSET